jgi:nicotinamide riboside kinase
MILVNILGAPSAGKSTGAAYVFSKLKLMGINAELVTEFAKDKVWEKNLGALDNQAYMFGQQYYKIDRCANQVDVVVTDSPLILSVLYNKSPILGEEFNNVVARVHKSYNSLNYLLKRTKPYNPVGRVQTEIESDCMMDKLVNILDRYNIEYEILNGDSESYDKIIEKVLEELNNNA